MCVCHWIFIYIYIYIYIHALMSCTVVSLLPPEYTLQSNFEAITDECRGTSTVALCTPSSHIEAVYISSHSHLRH